MEVPDFWHRTVQPTQEIPRAPEDRLRQTDLTVNETYGDTGDEEFLEAIDSMTFDNGPTRLRPEIR